MTDIVRRSKPDDYEPPYPAFQAVPHSDQEDYALAMIGVQSRPDDDAGPVLRSVLGDLSVDTETAPRFVEVASHLDPQGHRNDVAMAYWPSGAVMQEFLENGPLTDRLTGARSDGIGLFVESLDAPLSALDGNYARPDVRYGIARASDTEIQQFHSYMGSMRDRIPDFLSGAADGDGHQLRRLDEAPHSLGRVLRIDDVPANLCFIRGAFSWNDAGDEEQQVFTEQMLPVYRNGATQLQDDPIDSNCVSMRLVWETHLGFDNGVQTDVLGWFVSLQDLERWTREHPRHLAILDNIYAYMGRFDFKPKLNLGHEVAVARSTTLIYNNCHPDTGFLPFFPASS